MFSYRVVNGNDMVPHIPFCRFSDKSAPIDSTKIRDENELPISPDQLKSDPEDTGDFRFIFRIIQ
jgi:hypothetical protein